MDLLGGWIIEKEEEEVFVVEEARFPLLEVDLKAETAI